MGRVALITGITGQDGSYLAELLLSKGYEVHGIIRRSSSFNTDRIEHLREKERWCKGLFLHYGDISDASSVHALIERIKPDEVYNLAAQSHVRVSFDVPIATAQATAMGALHVLEAIRQHAPKARFYQASSSEMFGKAESPVQDEDTPLHPRSPYGVAKVYAYWITRNYREAYGMFTCNGILFNHESPRRGGTFVTRKITRAIAAIKAGQQDTLYLGNLDAKRDWGYAPEYVEAMWRMLQQKTPDDYVIATGETHTVREFCEEAFKHAGMELKWEGKGVKERGVDRKTGKTLIQIDPRYFRPSEVDVLIGNPAKAKRVLGWAPKVTFHELVRIMVDEDAKALKEGTDFKFR